jgi:hypothetical protein
LRKIKRFMPSRPVVAAVIVSLVVGGVGSATAASLITGKQIKNGSIQFGDLSKKAKKKLRGKRGGIGATGAAGAKGDKGDTGLAATKLWARVKGNGTLDGGSGVTNVTRTAAGRYTITFDRDVSSCAWIAMPVFRPGPGWGAIAQGNTDGTPEHVVVFTSLDTSATVDEPFDLAVFC